MKVELDYKAVREVILKGDNVLAECLKHARRIAANCGSGYATDTYTNGKTRNNASVWPITPEARNDNYENNTLLKAAGGNSR